MQRRDGDNVPQPEHAMHKTAKRTRGDAWMAIRRRVMARDCGMCQQCKRAGRLTLGDEVDHIVSLAAGGSDDLANLELLCHDCHAAKTREDMGHKPRPMIGMDGWPV